MDIEEKARICKEYFLQGYDERINGVRGMYYGVPTYCVFEDSLYLVMKQIKEDCYVCKVRTILDEPVITEAYVVEGCYKGKIINELSEASVNELNNCIKTNKELRKI